MQHPYDVGDWIETKDGQFVVDRILLTHTTYHTLGDKISGQINHVEAAKLNIMNKSRSLRVREVIDGIVSFSSRGKTDPDLHQYLEDHVREILKEHPLSRYLDTKKFELGFEFPRVVVSIYHKVGSWSSCAT